MRQAEGSFKPGSSLLSRSRHQIGPQSISNGGLTGLGGKDRTTEAQIDVRYPSALKLANLTVNLLGATECNRNCLDQPIG